MTKVMVTELEGDELDRQVARCALEDGFYPIYMRSSPETGGAPYTPHWGVSGTSEVFRPSTRGDHAQPIIEREKIHTEWSALWEKWASRDLRNARTSFMGDTALVAAMRNYVASRRGTTVEVPDPGEDR